MVKYHLAMMRQQKASAIYKMKADSAQRTAMTLEGSAHKLAEEAQQFQDVGDGWEAQLYMWKAHGTMNNAVKLQGWAKKMDKIARKVGAGVPLFAKYTGMAAKNAVGTYSEDS